MTEPDREQTPDITHIVEADGKIYAKGGDGLGRGRHGYIVYLQTAIRLYRYKACQSLTQWN